VIVEAEGTNDAGTAEPWDFGAGAAGMSTYSTDVYSDGQLCMKSRAGAFLNAGGLPIE
jgi:hypothetical protein